MNLLKKILFLLLSTGYLFASDSYMKGIMSHTYIESIDENALLFSMVRGEQLPSISSSLYAEVDLEYSTDFSFDILEFGLYGAYIVPLGESQFFITPRMGIDYESLDLNGITMEEGHEDLKGLFFSYGLELGYTINKDMNFFIDATDKGNAKILSFGIKNFF